VDTDIDCESCCGILDRTVAVRSLLVGNTVSLHILCVTCRLRGLQWRFHARSFWGRTVPTFVPGPQLHMQNYVAGNQNSANHL